MERCKSVATRKIRSAGFGRGVRARTASIKLKHELAGSARHHLCRQCLSRRESVAALLAGECGIDLVGGDRRRLHEADSHIQRAAARRLRRPAQGREAVDCEHFRGTPTAARRHKRRELTTKSTGSSRTKSMHTHTRDTTKSALLESLLPCITPHTCFIAAPIVHRVAPDEIHRGDHPHTTGWGSRNGRTQCW